MAHWAALISVFVALSQTPAYSAKPRTRDMGLVHGAWCGCILPSAKLVLVLTYRTLNERLQPQSLHVLLIPRLEVTVYDVQFCT